jgi:regulator of replication initiation timing
MTLKLLDAALRSLDADSLSSGSGWVTVFPRGKHYLDKYDVYLSCDDKFFESIKEWWEGSSFKKPYLDKGHEFNESFGDFTEYRITDKGLDMFLVLNEAGKELVKSGQYKYLSPTFKDAKDSTGKAFKNVLYTVSLVNSPALLALDKIQNQIALSADKDRKEIDKNLKGGSRMELAQRLASMLKLNLAADDGSILAKIEELINSGMTIEELKMEVEKLKGQLATNAEEMAAMKKEKEAACAALDAISKEVKEKEAESVINLAIADGQFHPAMKELKLGQYLKDPESVKMELSLIPKKTNTTQQTFSFNSETINLSAEDKAILLDAGYDLNKLEDMALAKKFLDAQGGK